MKQSVIISYLVELWNGFLWHIKSRSWELLGLLLVRHLKKWRGKERHCVTWAINFQDSGFAAFLVEMSFFLSSISFESLTRGSSLFTAVLGPGELSLMSLTSLGWAEAASKPDHVLLYFTGILRLWGTPPFGYNIFGAISFPGWEADKLVALGRDAVAGPFMKQGE